MRKVLGCVAILLCVAPVFSQEPDSSRRSSSRSSSGSVAIRRTTWEYAVYSSHELQQQSNGDLRAGLNKLGEVGWELVTVYAGPGGPGPAPQPKYYFRRAKAESFSARFGLATGSRGFSNTFGTVSGGTGGFSRSPEPAAKESTKIFSLKHARAEQLEAILRQLYGQRGGARVAVDQRTNCIIVIGFDEQLEEIEALLSRLDQPAPENK